MGRCFRALFGMPLGPGAQAQAVSFYTVCRVGESSVIGQHHRPTQQPEALRRAAVSVMQLFGGGPEKGRT